MSITILINESQKRRLILEGTGDFIGEILNKSYELTKKIVKESSEQIGMNFEFLMTWGATIGGFVGPLDEYLRGVDPTLSEMEISLILLGVISSYYIDNKELVKKVLNYIKDNGLSKPFKKVLKKSDEFKSVFSDFVSSLGVSLHKITNILSYTFILPLLPIIYNMVNQNNVSTSEITEIVKRLSGLGLLTISGVLLKQLFLKLSKRLKEK